jgi:hypothetical protein
MNDVTTKQRIEALALHLGCDIDDLSESSHDDKCIELGRQEYLVLTDDEADQAAHEYVKDSLWAFNASFLSSMTDLPEEVFSALGEKCEGGNDACLRIVEKTCGLEAFVEHAISADGRGHFLSGYDGNENEQSVKGNDEDCTEDQDFYIYRTN